jgi:ATP-binding cassette subfamily F protein uup
MPLLRLERVSLAYGHRALLHEVSLEIRRGERVCLLGRNGEGKSSLMGLIGAEIAPDGGSIWRSAGIRIAHLAQEVRPGSAETVFDVVAGGLSELGRLLSEYHHAAAELSRAHSDAGVQRHAGVQRLARLQHELEAAGGWQLERRVQTVHSRLGLDGQARFDALSGGWRRRVMLARALVSEPDLLLLDEPTNHLDIEAIAWLEGLVMEHPGAVLFISHDRAFVRRLATRIIELDRGRLSSWPGNYDAYLRRKARELAVEAQHHAQFDKRLSQEEAWIRQGIKARRTRNEGRVRALEAMREQRRRRRERPGQAQLRLEAAERSGQLVFEAEQVHHGFGDKQVIRDFSVRILRGDRVGILGPNGAGKSTLIKLLLGQLTPRQGRIRRGSRLEIAYFDQQRERLDPDATVMDSVGNGSTTVTLQGRSRHVAGYLRDFLFPPERLYSPVRTLSGGERNRLALARLFARPANLLVLDEPTNDLDVETLELLEERLVDYPGTLLLVSHDRAFLDNVVTSTLVFEGDGRIGEYVGGYSDWLRQRREPGPPGAAPRPDPGASCQGAPSPRRAVRSRKPSYKDRRELEALPGLIESLEAEQTRLHAALSEAGFYQQGAEGIAATLARLDAIGGELEARYARWEELESQAEAAT